MWLFDEEADATYQGDEATVSSSSSSKFTIPVVDCDKEDVLEPPAVELDIVAIEVSLLVVVLDSEDGAWLVVEDAIAKLRVAAVALLSALVTSFVFVFMMAMVWCWVRLR